MNATRVRPVLFFLLITGFYCAWSTWFTFEFKECEMFPNYSILAESFSDARLDIRESFTADTIKKDGKCYLFSGPVPAILRLPFILLCGWSVATGLMIALFCAAVATFFALTLGLLLQSHTSRPFLVTRSIFIIVFVFNGISLHMVTIPTLHNESICAAMCFLMISIYLLARVNQRNFQGSPGIAILMGLSLSLSVACRFSYVYAVIAVGCLFVCGLLRHADTLSKDKIVTSLSIVAGIGAVSFSALLWYNYARFGSMLDFGMEHIDTMYRAYFAQGGYFRYDHFPYNFWSFFFRLPHIVAEFPFVSLPGFLAQTHVFPIPSGDSATVILNTNELVVSVFFLMPILLLVLAPPLFRHAGPGFGLPLYRSLVLIFSLQVMSILFTIAAIARYYYDFLPIMLLMAFIGAIRLQLDGRLSCFTIGFLAVLSLLLSFALPLNAIQFYAVFIQYTSPLLDCLF